MSLRGIFPIDDWNFKTQSILQNLAPATIELLARNNTETVYKKGQVVFREKASPAGVYLLNYGKVKKYKKDRSGKQKIIYVANSGELLGYHAVLAGKPYSDSAETLEESSIVFIPSALFLSAVNQSPQLSLRLLRSLSHEFTVFTNNLTLYGSMFVRERLALQLILLREKYRADDLPAGAPVDISINREDLASLVGTARENVIRILTDFKEQGMITTRRAIITILDVKALLKIAQSE